MASEAARPPIATPVPLGMSGLAVASLMQSALDLGWLAPPETHQVGIFLLAIPVTLQLLAAAFAYVHQNAPAGAGLAVLGGTWASLALVHLQQPATSTSHALGLLLLIAAAALAVSATTLTRRKLLPGLVFLVAAARFAVAGIHELTRSGFCLHLAGIVGLALAAFALCTVAIVETTE